MVIPAILLRGEGAIKDGLSHKLLDAVETPDAITIAVGNTIVYDGGAIRRDA